MSDTEAAALDEAGRTLLPFLRFCLRVGFSLADVIEAIEAGEILRVPGYIPPIAKRHEG